MRQRQFACDCVDFRINGLGTCKHVEAVLLHLQARFRRLFAAAARGGSTRLELVLDPVADTLQLMNHNGDLPKKLRPWFDAEGRFVDGSPEAAVLALEKLRAGELPQVRVSQEIAPWLENRHRSRISGRTRRH